MAAKLLVQYATASQGLDVDLARSLDELKIDTLAGHAVRLQGAPGWLLPDVPLEKQGVADGSVLHARRWSIYDDYLEGDDIDEPFLIASRVVRECKLKQIKRDEAVFLAAHEAVARGQEAELEGLLPLEWRGCAAAAQLAGEVAAARAALEPKGAGACKHAYIFMACTLWGPRTFGFQLGKRAASPDSVLFRLAPTSGAELGEAEAETVDALSQLAMQVEQVAVMHVTVEHSQSPAPLSGNGSPRNTVTASSPRNPPRSPSPQRVLAFTAVHMPVLSMPLPVSPALPPSMSPRLGGMSPNASEQLVTVLNDLRLRIPEMATVPRRDVSKAATRIARISSLLVSAVQNYEGDSDKYKELVFRTGRVLMHLKHFVEMVKDGAVDPQLYLGTLKAVDDAGSCLVWLFPPEKPPLLEEVEGLMAAMHHRVDPSRVSPFVKNTSRMQRIEFHGRVFSALSDDTSPARNVIKDTCALLTIEDPEEYGLLRVDATAGASWLDITRPLLEQVSHESVLLLRKRLYFFNRQLLRSRPEERHKMFLKVHDYIRNCEYFSCSKDEAVMLAAYNARIEFGPCKPRYDVDYQGFLPIKKRTQVIAAKVAGKYAELGLENFIDDYDVEGLYLQVASQNRTLGATLFHVTSCAPGGKEKTDEVIAVRCHRFTRMLPKKKDVIKDYDLLHIRKLKYDDDRIVIDFGVDGIYNAQTTHGGEIAFLLLQYMRHLTNDEQQLPTVAAPAQPLDELIEIVEQRAENMRPIHGQNRTLDQSIEMIDNVRVPFMKGLTDLFVLAREAKIGDIALVRSRTIDLVQRIRVAAGTLPSALGAQIISEAGVVLSVLRLMLRAAVEVFVAPQDSEACRRGMEKIAELDSAYGRMVLWLCTYRDIISAADSVEDMAAGLRSVSASEQKVPQAVSQFVDVSVDAVKEQSKALAEVAPQKDPESLCRAAPLVAKEFAVLCSSLRRALAKHVQYRQWLTRIKAIIVLFREIAASISADKSPGDLPKVETRAAIERGVRLLHMDAIPCLIAAETDVATVADEGDALSTATTQFRDALQAVVAMGHVAATQKRKPDNIDESLDALDKARECLLQVTTSPQYFLSAEQYERIIAAVRAAGVAVSRHMHSCLLVAAGALATDDPALRTDALDSAVGAIPALLI
eukprot:m51a1_g9163 putative talin-1 (1148) ;mRNA; r:113-4533